MEKATTWLKDYSWEAVTELNQSLCESRENPFEKGKSHSAGQKLWTRSYSNKMTLQQALDLCRACYSKVPFLFNSGLTFVTIGQSLIKDQAEELPPLESHILLTTVGKYINDQATKGELKDFLKYLDKLSRKPVQAPAKAAAAQTVSEGQPA